jgi:hypothetical protein
MECPWLDAEKRIMALKVRPNLIDVGSGSDHCPE